MTEVGTGGSVGTSNCATGPSTETAGETQYCTGQTGAIFTISSSGQISPVLSKLPSVIEENIQEVTGPSAIAYGHGQEALTIDDFLVNKDGTNHLLPKPFASAFGTLRLLSARRPGSSTSPLSRAAHPQPAFSLGTIPGETPYDSDRQAGIPAARVAAWGLAAMRRGRGHGIVGVTAACQRRPGAGPRAASRQQSSRAAEQQSSRAMMRRPDVHADAGTRPPRERGA